MLANAANYLAIPKFGHVRLNGDTVWQSAIINTTFPNFRGVNVILVNPFDCSMQVPYRRFDTHLSATAATELSDYLQQISCGTIVVGVSAGEPSRYLANALSTLSGLGVDVSDVQYRGAFGFVAQKGFSAKTVIRKVLTEEEGLHTQPNFTATVTGTRSIALNSLWC